MTSPNYFYTVAVATLVHSRSAIFTYHAASPLPKGAFVRVPVGRNQANGVVLNKVQKPKFPTKPIQEVLHEGAVLPSPLLGLADWLGEYYVTHLGLVLQSMLPPGMHKQRRLTERKAARLQREHKELVLTSAQQAAVQAITSKTEGSFLLHGVPG